jgi:hypothetical protein
MHGEETARQAAEAPRRTAAATEQRASRPGAIPAGAQAFIRQHFKPPGLAAHPSSVYCCPEARGEHTERTGMNPSQLASALVAWALLLNATSLPARDVAGETPTCAEGQLRLMILGTYHMNNPGLDTLSREADDVLSDRRQAEIEDVVARLARFEPDRILVEAAYGNQSVREQYEAFVGGEHTLSRNEIQQIGYRLARRLGHPTVYPIDYPMFQDSTAYEFYVARYPEAAQAGAEYRAGWPDLAAADDERLRQSTLAQYLAYLNGEDYWGFGLDSRYVLATSIRFAAEDQYAGADILTSWYKRNLRMLTNVHRALADDDQRALLIVGSGHNKILWELVDTSPLLCRVDPRPYLTD